MAQATAQSGYFLGTPRDLADVLLPFVTSASFVTYPDENKVVQKAKLHVDSIERHAGLIKSLKVLHPTLSFNKTAVSDALRLVHEEKNDVLNISDAHFPDWHVTIERRLRNMLGKSFKQKLEILRRLGSISWIGRIQLTSSTRPRRRTSLRPRRPALSSVGTKNYGWLGAKLERIPWSSPCPSRSTPCMKKCMKIKAVWPDGQEHLLDMTIEELEATTSASSKASTSVLWESMARATNHKLTIRQKVDKMLLLIFQEQTSQILQVRVDIFGDPGDQSKPASPDNKALQAASAFLQHIGESMLLARSLRTS
jgi:hypothetical protein